ncbi:hypothetical protein J7T55_008931 [Diaporthe amygdali]|uniref:uncharacterized protein n=1 Tax=Phomopsis amygdali TaxID=1214568 RepID=UPI0022FED18B|nr:uncharacterized protein J7T55_008931 [Diaporthe amygdali]KAJ0121764.1 hypothetical protein J7T55_008931 [Diaporthe amygdali]
MEEKSSSAVHAVAFQEPSTMDTPDTPTAAAHASQKEPIPVNEVFNNYHDQFHDFDDPETYNEYMEKATSRSTSNFVVRFGANKSRIATNLTEQDVDALIHQTAPGKGDQDLPVTWINLWSVNSNVGIIRKLAHRYKFSTRLMYSILTWDVARQQLAERSSPSEPVKPDHWQRLRSRTTALRAADPEQGVGDGTGAKPAAPRQPGADTLKLDDEDLDMFKLLQGTYNYTTVDHGPDFICIGANWLHERPKQLLSSELGRIYEASAELVPPKHWAWYILTSDQAPVYLEIPKGVKVDHDRLQKDELQSMRKNTSALLSQLSAIGIQKYLLRISASKGVRSDLKPRTERGTVPGARTTVKESEADVDGSANLFFYLFEDYSAGISILKDSSTTLSRLTDEVLQITGRHNKDRDTSYIIKTLYARSKDLRQLKHLFESYGKLIMGVMDLGTETGSDDKEAMTASTANLNGTPARGVKLSQKAYDRFARLNDRLKLLMLDTIDEYLEEKSSLSSTYFNLLALKDSQATAKLNRSASLLAKLSVFFLPISFMTSYFSVEIPDLSQSWTGRTYWISFAVIATLSFMSLFFFSRLLMIVSDILDEKLNNMQKGTWRTVKTVTKEVSARTIGRRGSADNDEKRLDEE